DDDRRVKLNADRIRYWLSVGAQPSNTVAGLLKKNGIDPTPGTPYTPEDSSSAAEATEEAKAG
ncbi:MAG: 30S ribosomal protein S16, partial [Planctomycetota bacterium]